MAKGTVQLPDEADAHDPAVQLLVHNKCRRDSAAPAAEEIEDVQDKIEKVSPQLAREYARHWGRRRQMQRPLSTIVELQVGDEQREAARALDEQLEGELDRHRIALGYPVLRPLQKLVCAEAINSPRRDLFLVAPCGYGKSLCFALAGKALGGITVSLQPCFNCSCITELVLCFFICFPACDRTSQGSH